MTDFRALCAELVAWAEKTSAHYYSSPGVLIRARAALAEPQPPADGEVKPTVMEIVQLADEIEAAELGQIDLVRAALARWGTSNLAETRSSLEPVPVSERLPEAGDCAPWPAPSDASAWCWVGSDVDGGWNWERRSAGCLQAFPDDYTHWLPAHALPLPSGEVE